MKKTNFIAFMIFYNFIISLLASSLAISTIGDGTPDAPLTNDFTLSTLGDTIKLIGGMLTFSVEGIPNWFIFVFFYIPNIALLLVIFGFILNRDN